MELGTDLQPRVPGGKSLGSGRPIILVVDDRAENLVALGVLLSSADAELVTASSGQEAIEMALTYPEIALILLDVQMPEMDGFETAQVLRMSRSTKTMPIIFVTANNLEAETIFKGYECGAVDFLAKPITRHTLLAKVNVFLELAKQKQKQVRMVQELEASKQTLTELAVDLEIARDEALQASRAKSEFLANMSHEIRTPMNGILGFAQELQNPDLDADARREAIALINTNGEHLLQIINDILDISKIEAGKLEVEELDVSPFEIITELATVNRSRASLNNLELTVEWEGLIPDSIRTDPTRFRQVLINLLSNALKFTMNGSIRIVTRLVADSEDGPVLEVDVVDSGIGMTEEQATKVFEPFVQADNTTTRRFGGTGLGLPLSMKLAEALGGGIQALCTPGGGCVFRFTLSTGPLDGVELRARDSGDLAEPTSTGEAQEAVALPDCRLLVAEDNPVNQLLVRRILERSGAQIEVVGDGRAAVDTLLEASTGSEPFDLLLLDMQMPILDGYDAARELRARGYKGPIIALTANAMSEDRDRCMEAGCSEFLSKPLDRFKLLETIARLIEAA